MHGHGIYLYADGIRYDGDYQNDKKEGYGSYLWTDGRRYDGWWHKGKQHGLGTYIVAEKNSKKKQRQKVSEPATDKSSNDIDHKCTAT